MKFTLKKHSKILILLSIIITQLSLANSLKSKLLKSTKQSKPLNPLVFNEQNPITQKILDRINSLRNKVATGQFQSTYYTQNAKLPGATNMNKLTYNYKLATEAGNWAQKCEQGFAPISYRKTQNGVESGQVILYDRLIGNLKRDDSLDWDRTIGEWEKEIQKTNPDGIKKFQYTRGKSTVNALQLIWAKTREIGCAVASCTRKKNDMPFIPNENTPNYVKYYVCNLSMIGLKYNDPVYKVDTTNIPMNPGNCECEEGQCGSDTKFPKLCVKPLNKLVNTVTQKVNLGKDHATSSITPPNAPTPISAPQAPAQAPASSAPGKPLTNTPSSLPTPQAPTQAPGTQTPASPQQGSVQAPRPLPPP